jgi:hypothetical protein
MLRSVAAKSKEMSGEALSAFANGAGFLAGMGFVMGVGGYAAAAATNKTVKVEIGEEKKE